MLTFCGADDLSQLTNSCILYSRKRVEGKEGCSVYWYSLSSFYILYVSTPGRRTDLISWDPLLDSGFAFVFFNRLLWLVREGSIRMDAQLSGVSWGKTRAAKAGWWLWRMRASRLGTFSFGIPSFRGVEEFQVFVCVWMGGCFLAVANCIHILA